jgi:acyl-CoA hydrolase
MRFCSVAETKEVLHRAPPNPRIVSAGASVAPHALLAIVDEVLPTYRLNIINAKRGIPAREGVTHETVFVGPGMRGQPSLVYTPCRLSLVPPLFRSTLAPDIVTLHVAPPRDGKVSMGIEVMTLVAAMEAVKARGGLLLGQVNPAMPYTFGDGLVDVDDFDALLEAETPLTIPASDGADLDPEVARIGELTSGRVLDGATLQLGIGLVPNATLPGLSRRRNLGLWTEMMSDGVLALQRAGALDSRRDVVCSFALGSQEFYDWMHLNPHLLMRRTEVTNDPAMIARQPRMTAINTALQVDLLAQANASRIGARIYSGFGGQTDFIVGALHSPGGQALMALQSIHAKKRLSTIVPLLQEPVTSFQATAIITEQGVATVFGRSEREQARHIIDCAAHPSVRPSLWEAAAKLGLA